MEKRYGKYHCRFWFTVFVAFLLWFILCYFPLSHFICSRSDRSISQDCAVSSNPKEESPRQENITSLPENPAISPVPESVKPSKVEQMMVENHASSLIPEQHHSIKKIPSKIDPCTGRYIYVHDLPRRFNTDLLKQCRTISQWTNMCESIKNSGLGPRMKNTKNVFSKTGWFQTNQFTLEVIFHNRMKQYECLTENSSLAAAIFVPFYAGLDISRYLWGNFSISTRDSYSLDLINWLVKRLEWKFMGGKDHFLVAGRITWDFRRMGELHSDWGNKLLILPETKNMSILVIESSPWHMNDFAIPYPTYFHPANDRHVFSWQNRVRKLKRPWLFAFAGAPRPNNMVSIRTQLINQCIASKFCMLLNCNIKNTCDSPSSIMKLFQSSVFCLQPQGDSYTRRSAFDSMLAGCIPVFFHPGSAYVQYTWHLPRNYSKYSVFIPEEAVRQGRISIENILLKIPMEQVRIMRQEIIRFIPRLIYADPRSKLMTLKDAFDISVQAVIDKIDRTRKRMEHGIYDEGYREENSWKYAFLGEVEKADEEHKWDPYFNSTIGEKSGEFSGLDE